MPYTETKVYFDGSHYIAIPHTTRANLRRYKPPEEVITITENIDRQQTVNLQENADTGNAVGEQNKTDIMCGEQTNAPCNPLETAKTQRILTKTQLFEELYNDIRHLSKQEMQKEIIKKMRQYFNSESATKEYVSAQLDRKQRNIICRRVRCVRKANLQDFNYFVTFTYDDKLHCEESFRKKLKRNLSNNCDRKNWKYIGVWERSPQKKRLHFHGIFSINEGMMQGKLIQKKDYSLITHKMQVTLQNTHFNSKFGRSDFEPIDNPEMLGSSIAYILKYIEKTGEKIVYLRGLPQFFISDIMDEDVVCPIGMEDKKLLLFDDFNCWDNGEYIGQVGKNVINIMRHSN